MKKFILTLAAIVGCALWSAAQVPTQSVDSIDLNSILLKIRPADDAATNFEWEYNLAVSLQLSDVAALNSECKKSAVLFSEDADLRFSLPVDSYNVSADSGADLDNYFGLVEGTKSVLYLGFCIDLDSFYFPDGKYEMVIPGGYVTVNGLPNKEFRKTWTMTTSPFDEMQLTPSDGDIVTKEINEISIYFPNSTMVICEENAVSVKNEKGEEMAIEYISDEGQYVDIHLVSPLANGQYTVTVAADKLMVDGVYNKDREISWKFTVDVPYVGELYPPKGHVTIADLAVVTMTYPDDVVLTVGGNPDVLLRVSGVETKYNVEIGETPNVVVFKRVPYTTDKVTVVKFIVGEDSYKINGKPNDRFEVNYWLDPMSVDAIISGSEKVTVHTLDGILLDDDATAEEIDALAPGIYLINGKKILVK